MVNRADLTNDKVRISLLNSLVETETYPKQSCMVVQSIAQISPSPAVEKFIQSAIADSTRRAYRSDLAHYEKWGGCIPSTPEHVALYLASHAEMLSAATLARRIVSIGKAHAALGYVSPTESTLVKTTMRGIRRTVGTDQRRVLPILKEDVVAMVDGLAGLKGVRDRALLLIGFAGAFRRSELVAIAVEDIEWRQEGVVVNIKRSKTDQEGAGQKVGIPYARGVACPIKALQEWLNLSGIQSGKIFRSIHHKKYLSASGMSPQSVALIVKSYVKTLGLDAEKFAGHSLRAGLVTSAIKAGASSWKIRQQTRHKSDAMLQRYIRDTQLFIDNAAGAVL
jgi:integrase